MFGKRNWNHPVRRWIRLRIRILGNHYRAICPIMEMFIAAFVCVTLLWLPHQPTVSTPPPRNARWYRWYRHRRCHSPSLFLAFVQRNKPIMPGLSGAGGSWGWVSLSLIDLQTEQAVDMSEWLHDYTHCPFLGTRFGPVIHTAVAHLPSPPPPPLVHVCGQPHVSPVQASRKMI